jgi:hypothetical protein
MLASQHKPSVRYNEQFALSIEFLEILGKLQAFFGV